MSEMLVFPGRLKRQSESMAAMRLRAVRSHTPDAPTAIWLPAKPCAGMEIPLTYAENAHMQNNDMHFTKKTRGQEDPPKARQKGCLWEGRDGVGTALKGNTPMNKNGMRQNHDSL